jgi:hypothetical protein
MKILALVVKTFWTAITTTVAVIRAQSLGVDLTAVVEAIRQSGCFVVYFASSRRQNGEYWWRMIGRFPNHWGFLATRCANRIEITIISFSERSLNEFAVEEGTTEMFPRQLPSVLNEIANSPPVVDSELVEIDVDVLGGVFENVLPDQRKRWTVRDWVREHPIQEPS